MDKIFEYVIDLEDLETVPDIQCNEVDANGACVCKGGEIVDPQNPTLCIKQALDNGQKACLNSATLHKGTADEKKICTMCDRGFLCEGKCYPQAMPKAICGKGCRFCSKYGGGCKVCNPGHFPQKNSDFCTKIKTYKVDNCLFHYNGLNSGKTAGLCGLCLRGFTAVDGVCVESSGALSHCLTAEVATSCKTCMRCTKMSATGTCTFTTDETTTKCLSYRTQRFFEITRKLADHRPAELTMEEMANFAPEFVSYFG
jgi:hypothetical protein